MSKWDALASALDDIRHKYEESVYGREVTGNIELPQATEAGKWDSLSQEKGIIEPEPPQPEMEQER